MALTEGGGEGCGELGGGVWGFRGAGLGRGWEPLGFRGPGAVYREKEDRAYGWQCPKEVFGGYITPVLE